VCNALAEHSQGFDNRDDEAIEGCGELSHLIVAVDWQFGLIELTEADAVGDGGEPAYGRDDEEVEDEIDGEQDCGEGHDEGPHEGSEGSAGNLDGERHGDRDDLSADDFIQLPAKAVGCAVFVDHDFRGSGGNGVALEAARGGHDGVSEVE